MKDVMTLTNEEIKYLLRAFIREVLGVGPFYNIVDKCDETETELCQGFVEDFIEGSNLNEIIENEKEYDDELEETEEEEEEENEGNNSEAKQGWICPKCGEVLSPFVDTCPYCKKKPDNTLSALICGPTVAFNGFDIENC
jgi:rubrerythrin